MQKDAFSGGKNERLSKNRRSVAMPAYRGPERRKHDRREMMPDDVLS